MCVTGLHTSSLGSSELRTHPVSKLSADGCGSVCLQAGGSLRSRHVPTAANTSVSPPAADASVIPHAASCQEIHCFVEPWIHQMGFFSVVLHSFPAAACTPAQRAHPRKQAQKSKSQWGTCSDKDQTTVGGQESKMQGVDGSHATLLCCHHIP